MMASRVLSRFLPGVESVFQTLDPSSAERQRMLEADGPSDDADLPKDEELDDMLLEMDRRSDAGQTQQHPRYPSTQTRDGQSRAKTARNAGSQPYHKEDDNDVPASLLMEARNRGDEFPELRFQDAPELQQGPQHHDTAQRQHLPLTSSIPTLKDRQGDRPVRRHIDRKERALWQWTNVENIDGFLLEVYQYYNDHGIWSVLLSRLLYVLTTAFLFTAYMFLSTCIDYSKIPVSKSTAEILIPKCMAETSYFKNILLWIFVFWWSWSIFRYVMDIGRLWQLHDFYHHLLGIPDSDIQSIEWERVVEGLMALRDANPETAETIPNYLRKVSKTSQSKQRMDAHDIANRLMRRDNYYIALVNKEIFDLQLSIPFLGDRSFYSKSLEWCISFCFENFIFDHHGHVRPHCLDPKLRPYMIETLRRRLRFAAVISILMAPFNITAQCILFFSRYYAEFRNAPSQLGARAFTPLAEWKLRDFNELDHDFRRRTKMAYPFADRYLAQFPRDKTIQFLQFVSLIAGTFAAVLGVATLLDPELFLGFEITPNRTAFFYLSVSMGIFAAARSAVPDESEVHDPVLHLYEVIKYTHYAPQRWRNKFHTPAVRAEFSSLYQLKLLIFLDELLSLVAAPFILWRNAGRPTPNIVDFFRQNTVHVDGLGGLCNHAVFEFRKRTRPEDDDDLQEVHGEFPGGIGGVNAAKDNKMAQSQYYFMQRLGKYERGNAGAGHDRYARGYGAAAQPMYLPPAFPPLSPRKTKKGKSAVAESHVAPDQSVLLDMPRRRGGEGWKTKDGTDKGKRLGRGDDLTTSKLIEADHSLADSWKFDDERFDEDDGAEEARGTSGAGALRGGKDEGKGNEAGVVGLLMEYTKAHQIKKGGRIG